MFQVIEDYESNIHKRKPDSMNEKFVKEFMALSPLYDPSDPKQAQKLSDWEDSADFKKDLEKEKTLKECLVANRVQYPPS